MNIIYEPHVIQDSKLPFLLHMDTISNTKGKPSFHTNWHENIEMLFFAHGKVQANWHENIEILFFTEGKGQVIYDFQCYDVGEGDVFVINSNSLHSVISNDVVKYYCLIIDREFCVSNNLNTDNIVFKNKICDDGLKEKYEKIVNAYTYRTEYYCARMRCAVLELLIYLCENFVASNIAHPKSNSIKTVENIKMAIGYIKVHFNQKLTVDTLAYEAGLSKYHFIREFKKITGVTVITFLNIIRCEYAKKLLMSQKYTVHEVCNMSGFENPSYFSKIFLKFTGDLPSVYKKNCTE